MFQIEFIDRFIIENMLGKKLVIVKDNEKINKYKNCDFKYSTYNFTKNNNVISKYYYVCER